MKKYVTVNQVMATSFYRTTLSRREAIKKYGFFARYEINITGMSSRFRSIKEARDYVKHNIDNYNAEIQNRIDAGMSVEHATNDVLCGY